MNHLTNNRGYKFACNMIVTNNHYFPLSPSWIHFKESI